MACRQAGHRRLWRHDLDGVPLKSGASLADMRCIMAPSTGCSLDPGFIDRAPAHVGAWAACFETSALPVLRCSADAIEDWREHEDAVDAHLLSETLSNDPLLTIKVLAHVAQLRRGREGSGPETLTEALVMLGITPFFRDFGPQPTVEAALAEHPAALEGFRAVLARAHRAARFALAFAVQRMDHDNAVIHEAALLHDFAELLLWLRAPSLAGEIAFRQQLDGSLRSAAAQQAVLNVRLSDLQHELMVRWRLPRVLIELADDKREGLSSQARNVLLAIRLARHTALSWESPALADDVRDIADLLHMAPEPTLALLHDIDGV